MRQVTVHTLCDFCWQDGEKLTTANEEFVLGVARGNRAAPTGFKVLAVCEQHAKTVAEIALVLDSCEPLQAGVAGPRARVLPPKARRERPASTFTLDAPQCPLCDRVDPDGTHVKMVHGIGMDLVPRSGTQFQCPDCAYMGSTAQAVATHFARAHRGPVLVRLAQLEAAKRGMDS
jgi:hypothetical protein